MDEDSLELWLKPTLENIKEGMGFDPEDEEADEDALFQQGYESEIMTVYEGDPFEIPYGYEADVPEEEDFFVLDTGDDPTYKEEYPAYTLSHGRYRLDREENIFWREDEPDYDEEEIR